MRNLSNTSYRELSHSKFYSLIGGLLLFELLATYITVTTFAPTKLSLLELILLFVGSLVVVFFAAKTEDPTMKFTWSTALAVIFGLMLAPALANYTTYVIEKAILLTMGITAVMCIAGILFKNFFNSIGNVLFYSLMCLVIVRITQIFIPALNLTLIDYIAAGIFSLYIGYDITKSSMVEKTITNAIDVVLNLYLDIMNLFINLLSILGNGDD